MSGVIRGVKKIFRRVVKTVKKVLPYAIFAAAVVFTAGTALAAAGALGPAAAAGQGIFGWSTALSAAIGGPGGMLAGSPVLASVITGAVTQGIIGTAVGGAVALATGADLKKGMLMGGVGGLVTGGVTGLVTAPAVPAPARVAGGARPGLAGGAGADTLAGGITQPVAPPAISDVAPSRFPGSMAGEIDVAGAVRPTGSQFGVAGLSSQVGRQTATQIPQQVPFSDLSAIDKLARLWDSRATQGAISGAATALLTGDSTDRTTAGREERAARSAGFSGRAGLLTPTNRGTMTGSPIDPTAPLGGGRWVWSPETRRIEFQTAGA